MQNNKKRMFADFAFTAEKFIREHKVLLIAFIVFFASVSVLNFVDTSTSETVESFRIEDFEEGAIADRNIYARTTLEPDIANPVSIQEGERIIHKGFKITAEEYSKLKKLAEAPSYIDYRAFADIELFLLLVFAFYFFLFTPVLLKRTVEMTELILQGVLLVFIYACTVFGGKVHFFSSVYTLPILIPSSFCVFLIAILYGQTSAVYFSIISAMITYVAAKFQIVPCLFTLASGIAASRIVRKIEKRTDMVFSSLLLCVLNMVFMSVLKIIFNDNFSDAIFSLLGVALNGFIAGILALGFITPLESMLNTASVFRLMDLSNTNTPLLSNLMITASGTYQHSMMVAQLAENACRQIGANALLARVASYYHDIGKMDHSDYFTENQKGENPHDELNPSLSLTIIRTHVKLSVEKATEQHLPEAVIKIISEHHGNSVIKWFYEKAKKDDPNVREEDYSYYGDLPSTRESGVVMLADTVEAACKSLDKPSVSRLDSFIQMLIDKKVNEDRQLDNCPLTFKDLKKIKDSFVQILAGYYHSRVKYPGQKEEEEKEKEAEEKKNE